MKCEIEANIGCCKSCQQKVRRNLERIRGVESVEMYPEINVVVVTGKVEPTTLLRAVQEVKDTARILSKPANNSGVVNDEDGSMRDKHSRKTKKKVAPVAAPVDEEPIYKEAAINYYPEIPSAEEKDGIASEAMTYVLNLTAYGFGGAISYRKDVIYK
ncbi:heavy metal-associated isoprenylated plant protein 42-like [Nymphaea colorata]|uniref:heavy metal-associated isoprenylated plant protein 42-like n=1 Tax=Nymphaea colorata TaxID=210225 RepID=UPI00129EB0B7|nr:heavy metal-associated isoprenylated plant protein 42-like [Nymphaea colorata]